MAICQKNIGEKMKNIVADSNVWYSLASGNKDVEMIVTKEGRLCVTPTNLFELAYGINDSNFAKRKNTALVVLQFAKRYLQSNEAYLARYWGLDLDENIDWREGFISISKANSVQELIDGYADYENKVFRKQNIPFLRDWRTFQYIDYKQKVMEAVNKIMPNYLERIAKGRSIPKTLDENIIGFLDSKEFVEASLISTFDRTKLGYIVDNLPGCPSKPSKQSSLDAFYKVKPYIRAYAEFLKYICEFGAKPDDNDLGDHELFLYLQNKNWTLATADKRWVKIGQKACPKNIMDLTAHIQPHN